MEIGGVRVGVGADFHQHAAHAVAAEAVLHDDQGDEDQAGPQRDDRRGDEEFVTLAGFRENEEVHRADEDAEGDQDDDEKRIAEGLCAVEVLKWPGFLEIALL